MDKLNSRFKSHKMNNSQQIKSTLLRRKFSDLANLIERTVKDSREKSLAVTKLEEAMMWCNASLAREPHRDDDENPPKGMPIGEPYNSIGD